MNVDNPTPIPVLDLYIFDQYDDMDAVNYKSPDWNHSVHPEATHYSDQDWVTALLMPSCAQGEDMPPGHDFRLGSPRAEYGLTEGNAAPDATAHPQASFLFGNPYLMESGTTLDTRLAEAAQTYGVSPLEVSMSNWLWADRFAQRAFIEGHFFKSAFSLSCFSRSHLHTLPRPRQDSKLFRSTAWYWTISGHGCAATRTTDVAQRRDAN